ncbi:DUF6093 family protein [Amycolatopsis rhabdoformis]|uniref:DUF6093 family protein n=1 Tax=Amycolatopsis rhabdoformis TaxID=1448059 RepID=A0ABZ1HV00_9PSEU|nr:DUF6093 family protein [Amycolatopsis rhabdoformis]WSE26113.1 DUF6093 family protein [Amycolatopsis rhabdoformis]
MRVLRLTGAGRRAAEAIMLDACRIRPVDQDEVTTDPVTGDVTPAYGDAVYTGKCKIQNQRPFPSTPDAGEHQWTRSPMWLHLPVVGSGQVKNGHVVEITSSVNPDNVGRLFRVEAGDPKTFQTALRFLVEEIVG